MISPVVFDIDLTLTAERYHNDEVRDLRPNPLMVNLAISLGLSGVPIVISTARPERLWQDTWYWLNNQGIPLKDLYMRDNDDDRPDPAVKKEQAEAILTNWGNVLLWYDDNPGNIAEVKSLGIPAILVGNHV